MRIVSPTRRRASLYVPRATAPESVEPAQAHVRDDALPHLLLPLGGAFLGARPHTAS